MKLHSIKKILVAPLVLAASLAVSQNASAGLINSDFSNGLNDWSGDVNYFDGSVEVAEYDVNFQDFSGNFSVANNGVTLSTSEELPDENWGIYLFQQFLVEDSYAALSLSYQSDADYSYVTLVDVDGILLHDFMNDGLSVELSSYKGAQVALEFGVEDFDYVYDDVLTVSNISIAQATTSVPETPSSALLLLGLVAFATKSRSSKASKPC